MFTTTNTVDDYSSSDSLNNLIQRIDNTLLSIGKLEYDNIRLHLNKPVDFDLYEDLQTYRFILLNKLLGCNCLDGHFLINIVSRIKKLTK